MKIKQVLLLTALAVACLAGMSVFLGEFPDGPLAEGRLEWLAHPTSPALPTGVFQTAPIWTVETPDLITSTPATRDGIVYLRTQQSLLALDSRTGESIWSTEAEGPGGLTPAPIAMGEVVVTTMSRSRVAAFDRTSGDLIWVSSGDGPSSESIAAMTTAMDTVFVARNLVSLAGYAATDGSLAWADMVSGRGTQALTTDGHAVYSSLAYTLGAYDASSGQVLWSQDWDEFLGPVAATDGVVYVASETWPGILALDAQNGRTLWEARYSRLEPYNIECLVVSGDRLYLAESRMLALSSATGEIAWMTETLGRLECPVVLEDTIYVRNIDTRLYAFDAVTGKEAGRLSVGYNTSRKNQQDRSPIVVDGLLIVPIDSHHLVAYRP
jgi:outer membrane protein assembly factor BamB